MPVRKDARLHMEGLKICEAEELKPGDIVSTLPGLWSNIGMVCSLRGNTHVIFLDAKKETNGFFQNVIDVQSLYGQRFVVVPGAAIVPYIDSDYFDVAHPGRNGVAIVGSSLACVGWTNHSYLLFDAKSGGEIGRLGSRPVFISSWDILTKDADDAVVSLLEVRPD